MFFTGYLQLIPSLLSRDIFNAETFELARVLAFDCSMTLLFTVVALLGRSCRAVGGTMTLLVAMTTSS